MVRSWGVQILRVNTVLFMETFVSFTIQVFLIQLQCFNNSILTHIKSSNVNVFLALLRSLPAESTSFGVLTSFLFHVVIMYTV